MTLSIQPTGAALGARVQGLDLSKSLDAATIREIHDLWMEHIVLVFPGQDLTQDEQLAFAGNFGQTGTRSRRAKARPEGAGYHDGIMLITNKKDDKGDYVGSLPDGEMWFHHDMCYMPEPHKGTFLYAIDLPSVGGNTKFANMYKAYDNIPDALKQTLKDRTALQVYDYKTTVKVDIDGDLSNIHHRSQPIFVTNPDTGRTALYVNRLMTARIDDLPRDESDAILEQLFDITEDPAVVYEHEWTKDDLLMWDNRCSIHARTDFPPTEQRLLRRCTLLGSAMVAAAA